MELTVDCPLCRNPTVLEKQSVGVGLVFRIVRCDACHKRWDTVEKIAQEIPYVSHQQTTSFEVKPESSPQSDQPSATGGGGVLALVRSEHDVAGLDRRPPPQTLTGARVGRGRAFAYPAEFEVILEACEEWRGHKGAAFRAWIKNGKPQPDVISAAYAKWRLTDQWRRGFVPHLSTWLNARGWEKMPNAEELQGRTDAATEPQAPREVRQEAFRAQAALNARLERVKADLNAGRRLPPTPVTDLVQHLADKKGLVG